MLYVVLQQINNPQYMMDSWGGGFGMGLMMIFWVLILGLIGTLIWFLIQKGNQSPTDSYDQSSLEILKKRYASGEIDEDQYHRMKKEIAD